MPFLLLLMTLLPAALPAAAADVPPQAAADAPPPAAADVPSQAAADVPPQAAADDEPVEDNVEADAEIEQVRQLLDHDLPDASGALSTDVDRWVLHHLLQRDLAMSRPAATVRPIPDQSLPRAPRPLAQTLTDARLLARLRGAPEQLHPLRGEPTLFDIPLANHPLVDLYIDYFSGRGRWFFSKWLERSQRFIPMMRPILARAGVPEDLVYVAMIESGFSASAYSSAAAAGYWQFIGPTGKLYGLAHTLWVDERRDFLRSTEAAARYLRALYREMGDWHLAWACYNAGEGRIRRALSRYNTHDFWQLIAYPKSVAKETMHYVPKVIAAARIAKNPQRYGFAPLTPLLPYAFDSIPVKGALDLRVLARRGGVSLQELRELNPALLHDITPPHQTTALRVPRSSRARLATLATKLPTHLRLSYAQVRVQRGDTLFGLARRHHADLQALKEINQLRRNRLQPGQMLIIPSLPGGSQRSRAKVVRRPSPRPASRWQVGHADLRRRGGTWQSRGGRSRHVVVPGETLWSIARRYGVSVDRIKRSRRGPRILAGDVLEIM